MRSGKNYPNYSEPWHGGSIYIEAGETQAGGTDGAHGGTISMLAGQSALTLEAIYRSRLAKIQEILGVPITRAMKDNRQQVEALS